MFLEMLFLAGLGLGGSATGAQPHLSLVNSTNYGGYCNFDSIGQSASITINWTVTAPNDTEYEIQLWESGSLYAKFATSAPGTYEFLANGVVGANAPYTNFSINAEVRLVRKSDGVVLESGAASNTITVGDCR